MFGGFLGQLVNDIKPALPAIGSVAGSYFGPWGAAAGNFLGNELSGNRNLKNNLIQAGEVGALDYGFSQLGSVGSGSSSVGDGSGMSFNSSTGLQAPSASGLNAGVGSADPYSLTYNPNLGGYSGSVGGGVSGAFASSGGYPSTNYSLAGGNSGGANAGGFNSTLGSLGNYSGSANSLSQPFSSNYSPSGTSTGIADTSSGGGILDQIKQKYGLGGGGANGSGGNKMMGYLNTGMGALQLLGSIRDYKDSRQQQKEHQQYAGQLEQLMANPSLVQNQPGYMAGLQAVQRAGVAQGLGGSGALIEQLAQYGGQQYQNQINNLFTLEGRSVGTDSLMKQMIPAGEGVMSMARGMNQLGYF